MRDGGSVHQPLHRCNAAAAACNVDVLGAGFFQCEAHKFAAPLYLPPVIELVSHGALLRSRFNPPINVMASLPGRSSTAPDGCCVARNEVRVMQTSSSAGSGADRTTQRLG